MRSSISAVVPHDGMLNVENAMSVVLLSFLQAQRATWDKMKVTIVIGVYIFSASCKVFVAVKASLGSILLYYGLVEESMKTAKL